MRKINNMRKTRKNPKPDRDPDKNQNPNPKPDRVKPDNPEPENSLGIPNPLNPSVEVGWNIHIYCLAEERSRSLRDPRWIFGVDTKECGDQVPEWSRLNRNRHQNFKTNRNRHQNFRVYRQRRKKYFCQNFGLKLIFCC
jgi:hypothetical protein